MEFEKDLKINKFALDDEWQKQSQLYADWSEKAIEASFEVDTLKSQIDLKKAMLDKEIRLHPRTFGIEKITENAIASAILMDVDYQELNNEFLQASKRMKILQIAIGAFEHKKKALENLVQLHLRNYNSEPRLNQENQKMIENENQRIFNESMKEKHKFSKKRIKYDHI